MKPIVTPGLDGLAVHVVKEGADFEVWLDAEPGDERSGICLGSGATVREALGNASAVLAAGAHAAMVAR